MELTTSQIDEFKESFSLFDKDNDALLTYEDFVNVITALGITTLDIKKIFDSHSTENSMNFEQFLKCMIDLIKNTNSKEVYEAAFSAFDKEENGMWDIKDFRDLLTHYGEKMTEEEINEMIMLADTNNDGFLDKKEFMRMVMPCD